MTLAYVARATIYYDIGLQVNDLLVSNQYCNAVAYARHCVANKNIHSCLQ